MSRAHREYLIVVEKAEGNFGAYAPDLPGCVATGGTARETLANMRGAIAMHLEGMREDGLDAPRPSAKAMFIAAPNGRAWPTRRATRARTAERVAGVTRKPSRPRRSGARS